MTFKDMDLSKVILKSLEELNHKVPTNIQELAIPEILKGNDVLACAQTGTGKTAAFVLPIIELLMNSERKVKAEIQVLVLSPTRELAIQTRDNFRRYARYTDLQCGVVLGGVNQRSQETVLKRGVDVLVATPGRLIDLVNQRIVDLRNLKILVLDEADTMLDMGFIHDIRRIINFIPRERQTLMFSATMPESIKKLSTEFLKKPVLLQAITKTVTVDKITQSVYHVDSANKTELLMNILRNNSDKSTLIFTRTKHKANKLSLTLEKNNMYNEVIHGNKSQNARIAALNNFKTGKSKILIATDIAARGIDITELSQVINYELPEMAESYVHRIGRTGRAGCVGNAISLCDRTERRYLGDIERLIKQKLEIVEHNYKKVEVNDEDKPKKKKKNRQERRNNNNQQN